MKLQTKLTLWFGAATIGLLIATQVFETLSTRQLVTRVGQQNISLLSAQEVQSAENVHSAVQFSMARFLEKGEMEAFAKIVELRKQIKGFEEFSLYNEDGVVSYSSEKSALKRKMDPDLKTELFVKPEQVVRQTADRILIYQPQIARKSCIECHTDWKQDSICGVTLLAFSTAALSEMKAQCAQGVASLTVSSVRSSVVILAVGVVFSLGVAFWLTRSIARPIKTVAQSLSASSDRTLEAVNHVSSSSQTLAQSAGEQAAALEETGASLEEMASMTKQSAQNAQKACEIARQTRAAAEQGASDMQAMTQAMREIQTSSEEISKIVKSIDEIAFQTNVLALNAAVEAARAGEAGLGFAVVADEVRNLAQRSAQSAKETAERVESALAKSNQGATLSNRVAASFTAIVERARSMDGIVGQVTTAAREQAQGIDQVNSAVTQMDRVTQSNAASAEESASAAMELTQEVRSTQEAVADLLRLVEGIHDSSTKPPQAKTPHSFDPSPKQLLPSLASRELEDASLEAVGRG